MWPNIENTLPWNSQYVYRWENMKFFDNNPHFMLKKIAIFLIIFHDNRFCHFAIWVCHMPMEKRNCAKTTFKVQMLNQKTLTLRRLNFMTATSYRRILKLFTSIYVCGESLFVSAAWFFLNIRLSAADKNRSGCISNYTRHDRREISWAERSFGSLDLGDGCLTCNL